MHSSRFQQRWLLSKCVSLLSRQEVNFKLIQQSLAKTSQILKIKSAVLLLQNSHYHCCVVTLVHTVKWNKIIPLNNRREITGSGQNSAATATLSWSFIGLHTFAQLNSIIHQRQQSCLVRARKHQRRNSHSLYNHQKVLNLSSCLDKTLNLVEVLKKYLNSLLGHQTL